MSGIEPPFVSVPVCALCGRPVSLAGTDTVTIAVGYAHGVCIRHRAAILEGRADE